jgi:ribosome recycling factor
MKQSLDKTVELFRESIRCIRGSTISSALLDSVKISYFGTKMELRCLALVTRVDNGISIVPHNPGDTADINKQLNDQDFKSYVYSKGKLLINVAPPTLDERNKIKGHIKKLAEEAKIAVRSIRKNVRSALTSNEKAEQDDEIQRLTDDAVWEIEQIAEEKMNGL